MSIDPLKILIVGAGADVCREITQQIMADESLRKQVVLVDSMTSNCRENNCDCLFINGTAIYSRGVSAGFHVVTNAMVSVYHASAQADCSIGRERPERNGKQARTPKLPGNTRQQWWNR